MTAQVLRMMRGFNQAELAAKMSTKDASYISRFEAGKERPNPQTVEELYLAYALLGAPLSLRDVQLLQIQLLSGETVPTVEEEAECAAWWAAQPLCVADCDGVPCRGLCFDRVLHVNISESLAKFYDTAARAFRRLRASRVHLVRGFVLLLADYLLK